MEKRRGAEELRVRYDSNVLGLGSVCLGLGSRVHYDIIVRTAVGSFVIHTHTHTHTQQRVRERERERERE